MESTVLVTGEARMSTTSTEEFLPILSAGRHRSARRGACFMEFASYLAGERWSDHPACTHPSLAALARLVNDLTSDGARSKLNVHISSVVGLNGDDPRVPTLVAILAGTSALPIASATRQSAIATGLVRCERILESWSGPEADRARQRIRAAFLMAPGTELWARDFIQQVSQHSNQPVTVNNEALLRTAVIGIADACVPDADQRLAALLTQAIEECTLILDVDVHAEAPAYAKNRSLALV
jgi:hypothetical protein